MGSLVPGWDLSPPAPHASDDEGHEPRGYFARLQSSRKQRLSHEASLTSPTSAGEPHLPLSRGSSMKAPSPPTSGGDAHATVSISAGGRTVSSMLPASLHTASMPAPATLQRTSTGTHGKFGKQQGPLVDWEMELESLRGKKKAGLHGELHHARTDLDPKPQRWWDRMDMGALNRPVEEVPEDRHALHGTFKPEFTLGHYRE